MRITRSVLALCVSALAFACNAMLGISDTTYRGDADSPPTDARATGGSAGTPLACSTHAQCVEQSGEFDPSACIDGRCVPLRTAECPLVLPATESRWLDNLRHSDPDPLIFGVFAQVPPELFGMDARNYDLALTEASRVVGGIPAAGGKRRPLVAVVCQNLYESSAAFDRASDHLIDELQVPGILAGLDTPDLEYTFRRSGHDHHVFFMNALDADRTLLELPDDGLMWHMLPGGESVARTYGPLFDRTVEHLREIGSLGPDEPARVALVTADGVRMLSAMSGALTDGVLKINGRPARENSADYFRAVSITASAVTPEVPDYTDAIELLREFSPHVIVALATDEILTTIIPALEADGSGTEAFYLLSPFHIRPDLLSPLLENFPGLGARLAGVNFAGAEDRTIYDEYQARFDAAFPAFAGTREYENYYDAAYYLIYAAAAAGTVVPLLGSDLANGMQRLLSGRETFSVGPDDLLPGFVALEKPGSSIVLNGAMGPPDFDPRTGAREQPGTVWCVDDAGTLHMNVLRLDAGGQLVGDFPCFDFGEP